jgi:predicted Fe-S protein YdhL (DUF1289 family)
MADKIIPPSAESPCINVCEMDQRIGLCKGCFRTIEEITAWSAMSKSEKRAVMVQLLARRFQRQIA